jgi:hypothetical protein
VGCNACRAAADGSIRTVICVPLDNATARIYRRTDSGTLIGLLPELRRLAKAALKERDRVENGAGEVDAQYAADLAAYAAATLEREAWIRTELKDRLLLPVWPGEDRAFENDG